MRATQHRGCLCRAEWTSMRFLCSFQSPRILRDLRMGGSGAVLRSGLQQATLEAGWGWGDGAGSHSMRERWVVWMDMSRIQPSRAAHPREKVCRCTV